MRWGWSRGGPDPLQIAAIETILSLNPATAAARAVQQCKAGDQEACLSVSTAIVEAMGSGARTAAAIVQRMTNDDIGGGGVPNSVPTKPLVDPSTNVASAQRTHHILYGDATGGGHLWPGGEGKTPFPQSWDENQIMSTTSDLATNPNLLCQPQTGSGGLYTKSGKPARFVVTDANGNLPVVDGVPVRVIIEPAGEGIITAYPKY